MRFSSRSSSKPRSARPAMVSYCNKDEALVVLADQILPRCTSRPYLYNMIAALAQHLESMEDKEDKLVLELETSLHTNDDEGTVTTISSSFHDDDSQADDFYSVLDSPLSTSRKLLEYSSPLELTSEINKPPPKKARYVTKLPERNRPNTAEERLQDVKLVDKLLSILRSNRGKAHVYLRQKLGAIKKQIQQQIEIMQEQEQQQQQQQQQPHQPLQPKQNKQRRPSTSSDEIKKSVTHAKDESSIRLELCGCQKILPLLQEENPMLYDTLLGHVQNLERQLNELDAKTKPSIFRSWTYSYSNSSRSNRKNHDALKKLRQEMYTPSPHKRRARRDEGRTPTAQDHWMDVMKLDEILDSAQVTEASVRETLLQLKRKNETQAKALQRQEAGKLVFRSFQDEENKHASERALATRVWMGTVDET